MSKIDREQLIELFEKAQFTDNYTQGQIKVDSPSLVQNLKLAFEQTEDTGWQATSTSDITINQTYRFYFDGVSPSLWGHFFKTLEQLCQNNFFRAQRGKQYYIIDLKYDSQNNQKPQLIQNYEILLSLIEILKKAAAFVDSSSSRMLFLDSAKLEVEPVYSKNELINLDISHVQKINYFIQEDSHESQKLAILSRVIINLCKNEPIANRFKKLLSNLKDVYEALDHDYAVFSSSFSYEKLRNDIENAKLEEQVKIHKVITDIQNQILGIPIATVIVATQFKTINNVASDYVYQFAVNTGISIGVLIFTIIMLYLVENQKQSLVGLKAEINRKDHTFKNDNKVVYDKTVLDTGKEPFVELLDRIKTQETVLNIIKAISIIACVITLLIYINITVYPW